MLEILGNQSDGQSCASTQAASLVFVRVPFITRSVPDVHKRCLILWRLANIGERMLSVLRLHRGTPTASLGSTMRSNTRKDSYIWRKIGSAVDQGWRRSTAKMFRVVIAVATFGITTACAAPPQVGLQFDQSPGTLPTLTLPYATYRAAEYNPNGDVCKL